MLVSSIFLLVSAVLPFAVGGRLGHIQRGRHQELAQRARGDVDIHKRAFDNARFTFYDVGLGACGQESSPGDFIVALNVVQYGTGYPGTHCFKSITISYGGKTAQATIMDECVGCPYGGLDFSTGLFSYFASENDGVFYGSWWFNDGTSGPTPSMSPAWTPTPRADWSMPTHRRRHQGDVPSTTSGTIASTTSPTVSSTTSPTESSTTSPTESSTTSPTVSSTTSPTESSTTSPTASSIPSATTAATSTSLSTAVSSDTDASLPTGVVIVPIFVPIP
ncbi:hypothetical protein EDB19DRAFT_83466 [Suillus lakei]|nr:hypothetical protein EDB19DRAFT_83466 [Suillus lakei]